VTRDRLALASLLAAAGGIAIGSASDRWVEKREIVRGGHRVLQGDFHVHTRFSDGFSSPMDVGLLARRQGLDVVGVTEHNNVFPGKIARVVSDLAGGARVIVGEEITSKRFHMIALGLEHRVPAGGSVSEVAALVHAQNGVAIAAHPVRGFWPVFREGSGDLDGAEVMHPIAFRGRAGEPGAWRWHDMVEFFEAARREGKKLAAIGSSDYHFFKALGVCRTFIFADDGSEAAVLAALRDGRTVVFDREGKPYGDEAMIALLEEEPLPEGAMREAPGYEANGAFDALGRSLGWFGFVGLLAFGWPRRGPPVPQEHPDQESAREVENGAHLRRTYPEPGRAIKR
jgi:predicted metal-dependent phosphoesterase TrpH